MSLPERLCLSVLLLFIGFDEVLPRHNEEYSRGSVSSHAKDWRQVSWQDGNPGTEYNYTDTISTRHTSPTIRETRALLAAHQKATAPISHTQSNVRVNSRREVSHKIYNGRIKATVFDGPRKRGHHLRHGGSIPESWQYSQDQPPTTRNRARPCVRCPGDRAVLATKGSDFVLMETPPIIPCHPWSSVEKVKSEIIGGPQPGTKMAEGSHKMVLHIFRRKRTLATCVIRYNVIVRKCPELELSPGVKVNCPLGKAWGSTCNLTCGLGYVLEGDSITECSDDLEWTGVQPQCILSTACPAPVSPENGHLSCRTPQHQPVSLQGVSMLPDGTVCHFLCQSGYVIPPEQSNLTRMRCIAGSWDSDQDPVCVETNELEEEELPPDITADEAFRFDGKDCPHGFCFNGGKCLTILNEPKCSCQPGYSGPHCEDEDTSTEDNTIV